MRSLPDNLLKTGCASPGKVDEYGNTSDYLNNSRLSSHEVEHQNDAKDEWKGTHLTYVKLVSSYIGSVTYQLLKAAEYF